MKKITFLFALLCASVMAFGAIDWNNYEWLGDGAGGGAYSNKYKMTLGEGQAVVNIQKPGFADEAGIYTTFPAGVSSCTLPDGKYAVQGAGMVLYLSAFTQKETEVTVVHGTGTCVFTVYYADGTDGGGGSSEPEYASEYCAQEMSSGNTLAKFTWETTEEGAVVITIIEALGGAADATYFRANGISLDKFFVGEEAASTYFTHACSGNKVTLSLIDANNAPALGTKITVNAIIEYATSMDGNAWPTLQFEYTYGGVCVVEPELAEISIVPSSNFAQKGGEITLDIQTRDQMGAPIEADVDLAVSPADMGSIEGNVFTFAKTGAATITASSEGIETSITLYGVPSDNLAVGKTVKAGYEPGNTAELSSKVVDGNTGTMWVTWADQPTANEWLYIDLEDKYNLSGIEIVWGGNVSSNYILQVRDDAPEEADEADDEAWETIATVTDAKKNTSKFTPVSGIGRYLRFHSLSRYDNCIRMAELRAFGEEWIPAGDDEKPVMVSAELVSKTWKSAVIAVAATDNNEVAKYHVVNADPAIDVKLIAEDGKITVTGLTAETAYNFTITALDASQNESDNSMSVAVTTEAHLIVPNVAAPVPTWDATLVKSLYSDAYDFAPASLNSYNEGWWDNPTMTEETIGEDHYLHYNLYRNGMIGVQFAEVSVATMEKVHIDVFASEAGSVTFRLITAGDAEAINNTKKTLNLQAGQWNSFDFDLSEFGDHNWTHLFQYAIEGYQDGGLVGEHISVDNVYCYRTSAWVDTEVPTNVSGSMASASYFSVVLALSAEDNSGAVSFVVKNGGTEVATGSGASGATVNITVNGLTPNTNYTFSVIAKDDAGNEADAISVVAQTAAGTPAAAPAPNFSEKVAVPVFCDALEDNPAIAIGGWGQSTQAQKVQLAEGDNVYYGTNFNYLGWELNPAVNATDMEKLHVDFFSPNLTSISITPISPGKEGVKVIALTANKWNSVDIDLSDYSSANIVWSNIFQMKFMDAAPAGGELFIDNVYFWADSTGTAIDEVAEPVQVRKMIENGQLVIIKNGVRYNVAGQVIR